VATFIIIKGHWKASLSLFVSIPQTKKNWEPDFGFTFFWYTKNALCCTDFFIVFDIYFFIVLFYRFIVLRRIFLLVGIHYYYRALTMYVTALPKPNEQYQCAPKTGNDTTPLIIFQRVLKLLSGMGLSINGKHVYCGDYIYSGHTMTLIMTYLVIKECKYYTRLLFFVKSISWNFSWNWFYQWRICSVRSMNTLIKPTICRQKCCPKNSPN